MNNEIGIVVLQPDTTNMYLYPAMLNFADAVEQNAGYCYDAFGYGRYKVMAVVEYNDSVAAWLCTTDKFNLRLVNVVKGVPILGEAISPDVNINFKKVKEAMQHYNEENNNAIRSYLSIIIE